LIVIVVVV